MKRAKLEPMPVVVIGGPTGSGKSALALQLCEHLVAKGTHAEILCADSITIYRGFDVGAAKPTTEERAKVPHHLLDLAAPTQSFTAADFVRAAAPVVARLHESSALPVIVGGTGFYLRALLQGMATGDDEDQERSAAIKEALTLRAENEGWAALYSELITRDPGSAKTVHANDHYRIVRALQAMALHGENWSALNEQARNAAPKYPGARFFCLQVDKDELRARVNARTEAMLAGGLVREVQGLLTSGVPKTAKPMLSVGYKECVEHLDGQITAAELKDKIAHETMRLAKRQMTWFKGERNVEWIQNLSDLKEALMLG